jgi:hypothetical protein
MNGPPCNALSHGLEPGWPTEPLACVALVDVVLTGRLGVTELEHPGGAGMRHRRRIRGGVGGREVAARGPGLVTGIGC